MQGCGLDDAALPRMRHARLPTGTRVLGDAQQLGNAATASHVRLDHVDVPALDQLTEAPYGCVFLTSRYADVDRIGQTGVRLQLLQPENAQLFKLPGDADGGIRVGAITQAGVDEHVNLVTGGRSCRSRQAYV